MSNKRPTVGFYGFGKFGAPLLRHILTIDADRPCYVYIRNPETKKILETTGEHPHYPKDIYGDFTFPNTVTYTDTPQDLIQASDILVIATPSISTSNVAEIAKNHLRPEALVLHTAKALADDGRRLSEVFAEGMADRDDYSYALISGGTIAKEMYGQKGTLFADIASDDMSALELLHDLIAPSGLLEVNKTLDLAGVEYAGAFKNVISVIVGMSAALGKPNGNLFAIPYILGDSIAKILVRDHGAKDIETFQEGYTWRVDMPMSALAVDPSTRNRIFGEQIVASDGDVDKALNYMATNGLTVESIHTVYAISKMYPKLLKIPAIKVLVDLCENKKSGSLDDVNKVMNSASAFKENR